VNAAPLPELTDYRGRFYERYASTHVEPREGKASVEMFRRLGRVWRRHFGAVLPRDREASIADIGCGNGALVWWLQHEGYTHVQGVERSEEQVDIAGQLGARNIVHADLRAFLQDHPGQHDVLILRDVLEHFTKLETLDVLELCRRALRPGGRLVLQAPNAESPFFGRIRHGDFTHEIAYCASSLVQLLTVTGFTQVRCLPTPPVPLSWRARLRMPLWLLVERFYKLLLFAELGRGGERIVTQGVIAVAQRAV
jgi:2-polyprenyl-3-methyl-5-hydroxy-6-metoxy-1,4-benzoquinol methylase